MKQWSVRLMLLAGLAVLGWWLWGLVFPPPQRVIRQRLLELARVASFSSGESPLAKAANCQKLLSFCTPDIEIVLDVPGHGQTLSGQDDLREALLMVRGMSGGLQVEFLDINVTVEGDRTAAVAELTAKAKARGETEVQVLKFIFKKVGGDWLIGKVQTVKTLSQIHAPRGLACLHRVRGRPCWQTTSTNSPAGMPAVPGLAAAGFLWDVAWASCCV